MTLFSIPKMDFQEIENGWKATIDCYPVRVHYTKTDGASFWMLDHVETIREDMSEYLDLMQHALIQEGALNPRSDNG